MLAPLGLGPRLKPKPLEKPPPPPCWRWPNSPSKMSPISPASPPKSNCAPPGRNPPERAPPPPPPQPKGDVRSEEHTSELKSLMRIPYAVFCLTNKQLQAHLPSTYDE